MPGPPGRRPRRPPDVTRPTGPWDPGLQNERTTLAWSRTIMSAYGASLLIGRLLLDRAPALAVTLASCSTVLAATLAVLARRRYRLADARLRRSEGLPDAKLSVIAGVLVLVVGVMALATVVLRP
jgi:uncharacterized membrane protein YidH (DUF202 family)